MGIKISRIEKEFILKTIAERKFELIFHCRKKEFTGLIIEITDNYLEIEIIKNTLVKKKINKEEEFVVYFSYYNTPHTFNTVVIELLGNRLKVTYPEGVYKNPERKHERIKNPTDIHISITLKGHNLEMNFPKVLNYTYIERPQVGTTFDEKNIKKITQEFHNYMRTIVSDYKIVILKDRGVKGPEEEMIYKSTQSLWIPSTLESIPIIDPFPDNNRVLTQNRIAKLRENEGAGLATTIKEIITLLNQKAKAGIYSELYLPLLYKQYFIGYIYLKNTFDKKEKIGIDLIEYVYSFSKILCYSLELHGYFKPSMSEERLHSPHVIDISASGLLFALKTDHEINKQLLLHSDLSVILKAYKRNILIGSRITRKFTNQEILYIGVQFLDITPEDYRFLYETLYGKPFSEESDQNWEGGIIPPTLKLD